MTDLGEIRKQALRLLSRRPQTRRQLALKLARRHSRPDVDSLLDELQELGLLDDLAVARDRARFGRESRRWGDARIRADLRRLGIDDKIIVSALAELNRESSEQLPLDELVASWAAKRGAPSTRAEIKKLFDHCLRRGFDAQRVRETLSPFFSRLD